MYSSSIIFYFLMSTLFWQADNLVAGAAKFRYQGHTFYGAENCIGVPGPTTLKKGDPVWLFGSSVGPAAVEEVISTKLYQQKSEALGASEIPESKALGKEMNCYRRLKGPDEPPYLAIFTQAKDLRLGLIDLPTDAIILRGENKSTPDEAKGYADQIRKNISRRCLDDSSLFQAKKYLSSDKKQQLLSLSIGLPKYKKKGAKREIVSIHICSLVVQGTKILETVEFSRSSSEPEHAEVEAPQLTESDWADTSMGTLGYLSVDKGKTWQILTVDVGFEGLGYQVRTLGRKEPDWSAYQNTPH